MAFGAPFSRYTLPDSPWALIFGLNPLLPEQRFSSQQLGEVVLAEEVALDLLDDEPRE